MTATMPLSAVTVGSGKKPWIRSEETRWRLLLLAVVAVLLIVWEVGVSWLHLVPEKFLPPPTAVIAAFGKFVMMPDFWSAFAFSLGNLVIGVVLSIVVGVVVGLVVGWFEPVKIMVNPFLWLLYSTPKVALAPMFILVLGLGNASKIALVFLLAVFPIVLNTIEGVQTVNRSMLSAGQVFGGNDAQLGYKVIIPGALPFILVGIQRGAVLGFTGEILGELLGGAGGLGHLLQRVVFGFRMDQALSIVIIVAATAVLLLKAIDLLRRRFAPWYDDRAVVS